MSKRGRISSIEKDVIKNKGKSLFKTSLTETKSFPRFIAHEDSKERCNKEYNSKARSAICKKGANQEFQNQ